MAKGENYTVIRLSGKTEFYPDADYFSILSSISHEYGSAGSNWDRPNMLLLNGKVVVSEGIADIAWNYGQRNRELHDEIRKKIRTEFWPEWVAEGGNADGS